MPDVEGVDGVGETADGLFVDATTVTDVDGDDRIVFVVAVTAANVAVVDCKSVELLLLDGEQLAD